jgi:hypothetical protein
LSHGFAARHGDHAPVSVELSRDCRPSETDDCESRKESEPKLKVKVMEDARALVVTLPGTNYQITYRKLDNPPGISGAHDLRHDDPDASLNRYEFLARAWTIASEKARELGWIV